MKKIIFLSLLFCISINTTFAQTKTKPLSIINSAGVSMKTYHEKSQLEGMNKGALIEIYCERIKVLSNLLPYIALTSKPGITIQDVGIQTSSENIKIFEAQAENIDTFVKSTVGFLGTMAPFADKGSLVTAILFFEEVLKSLQQLGEQ